MHWLRCKFWVFVIFQTFYLLVVKPSLFYHSKMPFSALPFTAIVIPRRFIFIIIHIRFWVGFVGILKPFRSLGKFAFFRQTTRDLFLLELWVWKCCYFIIRLLEDTSLHGTSSHSSFPRTCWISFSPKFEQSLLCSWSSKYKNIIMSNFWWSILHINDGCVNSALKIKIFWSGRYNHDSPKSGAVFPLRKETYWNLIFNRQ